MPAAIAAAGALLQYVKDTQQSALPHIQGIRTESSDDSILLDASSRRNLELDFHPSGTTAIHAVWGTGQNRDRDGQPLFKALDQPAVTRSPTF